MKEENLVNVFSGAEAAKMAEEASLELSLPLLTSVKLHRMVCEGGAKYLITGRRPLDGQMIYNAGTFAYQEFLDDAIEPERFIFRQCYGVLATSRLMSGDCPPHD